MVPLVVAVTGHRDLVAEEVPAIRLRASRLFQELAERFPGHDLTLLSPLAEGADTVVAEAALEAGVRLLVPLPTPEPEYLSDFSHDAARATFRRLRDRADEVFQLPGTEHPPGPPPDTSGDAWEAGYPYVRLGHFLSAHCHLLLAVWDGKPTREVGGTSAVVRFHLENILPGITSPNVTAQQMLVDDESDLVHHVVCSRDRPDGDPEAGLTPGDAFWLTKDAHEPRSRTLPEQHRLIFARSSEFGLDAEELGGRIDFARSSLLVGADGPRLPDGIGAIDRLFSIADQLAIHFQRRTLRVLKTIHVLAFLTGLVFILYSDLDTLRLFLVAFLGLMGLSAGLHVVATRGSWHRKYMDYRTLAEGLRVQFYWSAAGVTNSEGWLYPHDTFLRSQDPELGWIRNVMRAAGLRSNARPSRSRSGIDLAIRRWVGDDSRGQLGYFTRASRVRAIRNAGTEWIGRLSLLFSVSTVLLFLGLGPGLPDVVEATLIVFMGAGLLLFAVREGYAYATAQKELLTQYEHMLRVYRNARRRLTDTASEDERRLILLALGHSALDDLSDWLLIHRHRLFSRWRLGV